MLPYRWTVSGLPAGLSANEQGVIAGTPQQPGTYPVTAQVADAAGGSDTRRFDLVIAPAPLSITTTSPLPNAFVGKSYSLTFAATGGVPPYTWRSVAGYSGALELSSAGVLAGIPGATGEFTLYVQVTDSRGATAVAPFTFTVLPPPLSITTENLPSGSLGSPYSTTLQSTGGARAVQWSATGLPQGVTLGAGGSLSGTPAQAGTFNVTVTVTDAGGNTAARTFTFTVAVPPVPAVVFQGVGDTAAPATQPGVGLGLQGTYPAALSGTVTLNFVASDGGDDPAVQFSNGRRTADFTIPPGTNLATFTVPNLALQTGTVAGVITLTASLRAGGVDVTPAPPPSRTVRINALPPVITRVTAARTGADIVLTITGYSTPRNVFEGFFSFASRPDIVLQNGSVTVPVNVIFSPWYQHADSRAYGSQFTYTQPFTVQGDASGIISVILSLVNSAGTSNTVAAEIP